MIFQIENLHRNCMWYAFGCFFAQVSVTVLQYIFHSFLDLFRTALCRLRPVNKNADCTWSLKIEVTLKKNWSFKRRLNCTSQLNLMHSMYPENHGPQKRVHDSTRNQKTWSLCFCQDYVLCVASLWWEMLWELGCLKLSDRVAYRLPIQTLYICSCMGYVLMSLLVALEQVVGEFTMQKQYLHSGRSLNKNMLNTG